MTDVVTFGLAWTTAVLAQDGPQQTGPDFGKASPFGLIIVVLLLIATFLLVWSMNRHLRRLPKSFDDDGAATGDDADVAGGSLVEGPRDDNS